MTNQYEPFLTEADTMDDDTVTAAVVMACHSHITSLADQRHYLFDFHAQVHQLGLEGSGMHDDCLHRLEEVEFWITRGLKAVWS